MPSAHEQLIDNYVAAVQTLRNAVAGMTAQQARARPVPGKWSTLEVVCHLADFDVVYADRMKRILAMDQPLLISADENRYATALAYQDRDLEEELSILEQTRRQMARILRKQPPEAFSRVGIYKDEGTEEPRTLERLAMIMTNHIPHHAKFIHEKRKALGLPSA
jgi:uncharacterized damage-inducible protein DinB